MIRSMSGRYESYWNVFLLTYFFSDPFAAFAFSPCVNGFRFYIEGVCFVLRRRFCIQLDRDLLALKCGTF